MRTIYKRTEGGGKTESSRHSDSRWGLDLHEVEGEKGLGKKIRSVSQLKLEVAPEEGRNEGKILNHMEGVHSSQSVERKDKRGGPRG